MNLRRTGFLGYDDVQTLDIVGPIDASMAARLDETNGSNHDSYETLIIGRRQTFCLGIRNNS